VVLNKFKFDDTEYWAEDFIDGHLINPLLLYGTTPNWPFIIHADDQFAVHCLADGRLRCRGVFDNLNDALKCAKNKFNRRKKPRNRLKCQTMAET
jgi:hypothetical protein